MSAQNDFMMIKLEQWISTYQLGLQASFDLVTTPQWRKQLVVALPVVAEPELVASMLNSALRQTVHCHASPVIY